MIHYLYVGHFERDDSFIRFKRETDVKPSLYRPVVIRPLDPAVICGLLAEKGLTDFPDNWAMSMNATGYIVWDRFAGIEDGTDFIIRLANRTGCDVADYSSLTFMRADELKKSISDSRGGPAS